MPALTHTAACAKKSIAIYTQEHISVSTQKGHMPKTNTDKTETSMHPLAHVCVHPPDNNPHWGLQTNKLPPKSCMYKNDTASPPTPTPKKKQRKKAEKRSKTQIRKWITNKPTGNKPFRPRPQNKLLHL